MNDVPVEWRREAWVISTDRGRLDRSAILALLAETHWGGDLTPERLERAIENSVCFGLYREDRLAGFGRVVTDLATFGYLTDVVIAATHRGDDADGAHGGDRHRGPRGEEPACGRSR